MDRLTLSLLDRNIWKDADAEESQIRVSGMSEYLQARLTDALGIEAERSLREFRGLGHHVEGELGHTIAKMPVKDLVEGINLMFEWSEQFTIEGLFGHLVLVHEIPNERLTDSDSWPRLHKHDHLDRWDSSARHNRSIEHDLQPVYMTRSWASMAAKRAAHHPSAGVSKRFRDDSSNGHSYVDWMVADHIFSTVRYAVVPERRR